MVILRGRDLRPLELTVLRIVFLFVMLLLQPAFANAGESKFYGYMGSCDDAVYQLDFPGGKYTLFGVYRLKINNVPQFQYFTSRGKLTKLSDIKYMMEPGNGKPPAVLNLGEDGSIRGKTQETASFYFKLCEPKTALNFVKEVTEHTR